MLTVFFQHCFWLFFLFVLHVVFQEKSVRSSPLFHWAPLNEVFHLPRLGQAFHSSHPSAVCCLHPFWFEISISDRCLELFSVFQKILTMFLLSHLDKTLLKLSKIVFPATLSKLYCIISPEVQNFIFLILTFLFLFLFWEVGRERHCLVKYYFKNVVYIVYIKCIQHIYSEISICNQWGVYSG